MEVATGRKPKELAELEESPYPEDLSYLLAWFWSFYTGSSFHWSDLKAWAELNQISLKPWESTLLRQMSILRHNVNQ